MDQRTYSAISCPARLLVGEFLRGFFKFQGYKPQDLANLQIFWETSIEGWKILGGMRSIHQNHELLLKRNRIAWLIAPVAIHFSREILMILLRIDGILGDVRCHFTIFLEFLGRKTQLIDLTRIKSGWIMIMMAVSSTDQVLLSRNNPLARWVMMVTWQVLVGVCVLKIGV